MPALSSQEFVPGFPVTLNPNAIEAKLAELWDVRGGQDEAGDGDGGVTRITLGNLLWLGGPEQIPQVRDAFRQLVTEYPCRLFLLERHPQADGIEARVNAYCFLTGGQRQVCCEEIHLRFNEDSARHLRGAVLPLFVSDVPTTLWTRGSGLGLQEDMLTSLRKSVDYLVRDSAHLPDPAAALREMAECPKKSGSCPVVDLSWFRFEPLRQQIAGAFDDPGVRANGCQKPRLHIRLAPSKKDPTSSLTVCAALLAGWVASRLGWEWTGGAGFVSQANPVAFAIECDETAATEEGGFLELVLEVPGLGAVSFGKQHEQHLARPLSDAQAMGLALTTRHRSGSFRDSAAVAWRILRDRPKPGA
ncbi:MAG: glucose-6-phosphate dehydrogenase assembly protein OpcA [Sumerlaeia bacterium]